MQNKEAAEKRKLGTTRTKKRKGKSSHFDIRKKRKTLSNSKSDSMEVD